MKFHSDGNMPKGLEFAIIIEETGKNFSAYVPDLPGCVATGATVDEARAEIAAAIRFHIDGLIEDGLPVPTPQTIGIEVDV